MQTRLPFTCPKCREQFAEDIGVTVSGIRTPAMVRGSGLRCSDCYLRKKVWEDAEKAVRAAYEARLPRQRKE